RLAGYRDGRLVGKGRRSGKGRRKRGREQKAAHVRSPISKGLLRRAALGPARRRTMTSVHLQRLAAAERDGLHLVGRRQLADGLRAGDAGDQLRAGAALLCHAVLQEGVVADAVVQEGVVTDAVAQESVVTDAVAQESVVADAVDLDPIDLEPIDLEAV